jgi:WD40 repeat protein
MEWCPWMPHVLATGGGVDDGTIQFHNTETGKQIKSISTGHQVCQLRWSLHYKELISAQHSDTEQLTIWSFPSMDIVDRLQGHRSRSMDLARSPDGHSIASIGDDETLKVLLFHLVLEML